MIEIGTSWHSYPSIYNLGHKALAELLLDPVLVEEKVDGSQCSFGVFPESKSGQSVRVRSKGAQLNLAAPDNMFKRAVEVVFGLQELLHPGWTYRAEYLAKPKHNSLAYDRTPKSHLMVFDINTGEEQYLSWDEKAAECERLGLEVVPRVYEGAIESVEQFRAMLDAVSVLGGQKIEGVVIKNYRRFGPDKKALMGKFVSEAFREVHAREWKLSNPKQGDVIRTLGERFKTPARWNKAIQHLREAGQIEDSPRDIGLLMREVQQDIEKECADEIKDALYAYAIPQIKRMVAAGLADWYKEQLVVRQFEQTPEPEAAA